MQSKIGFIINPIAGMGGKVGLKGTDGVIDKAIKLGAKPIATEKAEEMLTHFFSICTSNRNIKWYTCTGDMGQNQLKKIQAKDITIIYKSTVKTTSANDTKNACKKLLDEKVDLIVFCGGDGTARDIIKITGKKIPLLGIPSGVKMHSGVFGINTSATAKMLNEFINNRLTIGDVEIMDLDEELYRKGKWNIKLFGVAHGIVEPTYVQVGKTSYESISDNEIKDEIAEHIEDEMKNSSDFLFLFGSGGTIDYIASKLSFKNTLLGVDAVYKNKVIGKDLNEKHILKLLNRYTKAKVILSPIGAQGFILGRGNLQLSAEVIKKIGIDNLIVVATPAKVADTPVIRVDSGDKTLDEEFAKAEFLMVVIGYRLSRIVRLQTNNF